MIRVAFIALFCASPAWADAPALKLPSEVPGTSGQFIVVTAETSAKSVKWVPLDSGLSIIPPGLLKDSKTAVLMAPRGRYRLLAYCAVGDEASEPAITVIVVDGATTPPADPPKPPPDVPAPPAPAGLYFMVIRPDGPAHPTFTQIMSLDAWGELRAKGHTVKDFTLTDARAKGAVIPPETMLPCVLTLRDDGKRSVVVRKPIPIPSTADAIRGLPEGIK